MNQEPNLTLETADAEDDRSANLQNGEQASTPAYSAPPKYSADYLRVMQPAPPPIVRVGFGPGGEPSFIFREAGEIKYAVATKENSAVERAARIFFCTCKNVFGGKPMSRQTAIDHHTRSASRAVDTAKCFKAMAAHFGELSELSKAMDAGPADILQGLSDQCSAMGDGCTDDAEFHVNAAKSLSANKSMNDERDFSQLAPTQISAVVPDTPSHAHTRAVPRFGAPIPAATATDPEFSKLFAIDDES
jgi:hypothetical protein